MGNQLSSYESYDALQTVRSSNNDALGLAIGDLLDEYAQRCVAASEGSGIAPNTAYAGIVTDNLFRVAQTIAQGTAKMYGEPAQRTPCVAYDLLLEIVHAAGCEAESASMRVGVSSTDQACFREASRMFEGLVENLDQAAPPVSLNE